MFRQDCTKIERQLGDSSQESTRKYPKTIKYLTHDAYVVLFAQRFTPTSFLCSLRLFCPDLLEFCCVYSSAWQDCKPWNDRRRRDVSGDPRQLHGCTQDVLELPLCAFPRTTLRDSFGLSRACKIRLGASRAQNWRKANCGKVVKLEKRKLRKRSTTSSVLAILVAVVVVVLVIVIVRKQYMKITYS